MVVEKSAGWLSYTSAGGLVIFGMTASDIALLGGLGLGVGTFLVNWYYQAKADRRAERAAQEKGDAGSEE